MRVRFIIATAKVLGTGAVSDLVQALEGDEEAAYEQQETHPGHRGDRRRRARARRDLEAAGRRAVHERGAPARLERADDPGDRGRGGGSPSAGGPRRGREPRGDHPRRGLAPERPVGDAAGDHLRGLGRPRLEPGARHGRRGRVGRGPPDPVHRHRRPARRRVLDGGRRVHLDAEPAGAVRAPDRARAGGARGDARGGAAGARRAVHGQGVPARGGRAGGRAHLREPGARARHARPGGARPRPRRARLALGRGVRLVRSRSRSAPRSRSCRTCSAAAPPCSSRASS